MSGMINTFPVGNVYPTANSGSGASLGLKGGASGAFMGAPALTEVQQEGGMMAPGNPIPNQHIVVSGLVFVGLLLALMFTAHNIGTESEFKNIKVSAYNVLVIALAAAIGLPVIKFLIGKIPVPALSAWVQAA